MKIGETLRKWFQGAGETGQQHRASETQESQKQPQKPTEAQGAPKQDTMAPAPEAEHKSESDQPESR